MPAPFHRLAFALTVALAIPSSGAAADRRPRFYTPPGFAVEYATTPGLVDHPVAAALDERGRLFVVESGAADAPDAGDPAGRVMMLEDTNADGRYDKSTVFADGLPSPQGVVCQGSDVFVTAGSALWRLRDANGDGACDDRQALLTGFGAGPAAIHGPCPGPDGLLYTLAAAGGHEIKDVAGKTVHKGDRAAVIRCRPDGSRAEAVGALDTDACDLAWTAAGDAILSCRLAPGLFAPGVITQFVEGDDRATRAGGDGGGGGGGGGSAVTDDSFPTITEPGVASPASLLRYRGMTLGRPFVSNVLCASSSGTVQRLVLEPRGATFHAREQEFLSSDDEHFAPADALEDADGSVLVIDSGAGAGGAAGGGGAIYRVRKDGAVRIGDPRGLKLNWEKPAADELARRLDDIRPCVALRAAREIARRGPDGVLALNDALGRKSIPESRLRVVWALAATDAPAARDALRLLLRDTSTPVRQAAAYACGLRRDVEAQAALIEMIRLDAPPVRREAAIALGRIGNPAPAAAPPPAFVSPPPGAMMAPTHGAPADVPAGTPTVVVDATPPAAAPAQPATAPTTSPATAPTTGLTPGPTTLPAAATRPAAPPAPPSPAVPALLEALRGGADPVLERAVVYALIRINDRESTRMGLQDPDSSVQHAAKRALDAMSTRAAQNK